MSAIPREDLAQPLDVPSDLRVQNSLGWAPMLSLVMALSVVVVSVGDVAARHGVDNAYIFFWVGLVIAVAPVAVRIASPGVALAESVALVCLLGVSLYLFKVEHSPIAFTFHDEFLHLRTASDIFTSGRLFHGNPLLPVSDRYPGLEIVTTALAHLTGMSLFTSGLLVIGVARLVVVLSLYIVYWTVGRSVQFAGVATVIYMANPNFVFFSAQFAYESLALAFACLTILTLVRRAHAPSLSWTGLTVTMILSLIALEATHHLTTYIMTLFLLLWTVIHLWGRRNSDVMNSGPGLAVVVAICVAVVWLVAIAPVTISYLAPHVRSTIQEVVGIAEKFPSTGRSAFQGTSGTVAPLWQRVAGIVTALLYTGALPFGLWYLRRRMRRNTLALTLGLASLLYPASLALRFTSSGWEIANRSSEFIFLAVGFTVAAAVMWIPIPARASRVRPLLFGLMAAVTFVGGVSSGWPQAWILPGTYLPAAGPRSIEPEGVDAALWARQTLGPGKKIGADRVNDLLMGSYGDLDPESTLNGGIDTSWLFLSPVIGSDQVALMRKGQVQYMLTDWRLTTRVPVDVQYEGSDPRKDYYATRPIAPKLLTKFDHLPGVSRIFDSGNIHIYDVSIYDRPSRLSRNGPTTHPTGRSGPGSPGSTATVRHNP